MSDVAIPVREQWDWPWLAAIRARTILLLVLLFLGPLSFAAVQTGRCDNEYLISETGALLTDDIGSAALVTGQTYCRLALD